MKMIFRAQYTLAYNHLKHVGSAHTGFRPANSVWLRNAVSATGRLYPWSSMGTTWSAVHSSSWATGWPVSRHRR